MDININKKYFICYFDGSHDEKNFGRWGYSSYDGAEKALKDSKLEGWRLIKTEEVWMTEFKP
jgi:hypothetical protein